MPSTSPSIRLSLGLMLSLLLLANLLQAWGTPLDPDEAYYWMYAQRLDWGYFDHPPVVALLIALGQWIPGELGVRLGHVLVAGLTWWGIYVLANRPQGRSLLLLFLLLAAMPMLEIYSFIATPDGPLLLGAVWFWLAYRRFLGKPDAVAVLLWAASMAFLLYSKYHGILLIGFTVLSNRKLWRVPGFYAAGFLGALLFLPHLYWQYLNDFPSFRYHLSGRDDIYELKYTLNYLVNQLVIFNPLLLPWLYIVAFRQTAQTILERSYKWVIYGFLLFFLWSTSKGHGEPQWTAILSIPLVVLLHQYWSRPDAELKWPFRLLWGSLALFILLRLALLWPGQKPLPQFNHQVWIEKLAAVAQGEPVIIENSYRDASLYRFYTGKTAWTTTDIDYRPSQYDLWDDEVQLQNQNILMVGEGSWDCTQCDSLRGGHKKMKYRWVDRFQTVQKHRFSPHTKEIQATAGEELTISTMCLNPYPYAIQPHLEPIPLNVSLVIETEEEEYTVCPNLAPLPAEIPANQIFTLPFTFTIPDTIPSGTYPYFIGWQYYEFPPMRQSLVETISVVQ